MKSSPCLDGDPTPLQKTLDNPTHTHRTQHKTRGAHNNNTVARDQKRPLVPFCTMHAPKTHQPSSPSTRGCSAVTDLETLHPSFPGLPQCGDASYRHECKRTGSGDDQHAAERTNDDNGTPTAQLRATDRQTRPTPCKRVDKIERTANGTGRERLIVRQGIVMHLAKQLLSCKRSDGTRAGQISSRLSDKSNFPSPMVVWCLGRTEIPTLPPRGEYFGVKIRHTNEGKERERLPWLTVWAVPGATDL